MQKIQIGIVGVGAISSIYLENITNVFQEIEIRGVCDLVPERALQAKEKYGISVYPDMQAMFADPAIDIILNLTRPYEHFDVSMAALKAGKHVYSEKPLGASLEEGRTLMAEAKARNLLLLHYPVMLKGNCASGCIQLMLHHNQSEQFRLPELLQSDFYEQQIGRAHV